VSARVLRVVLIGAESVGKTTLCEQLAAHYDAVWVAEYGREHWEKKIAAMDKPGEIPAWTDDEFIHIAEEQQRREHTAAREANRVLICDTNAFATATWFERYASKPHPEMLTAYHARDDVLLLAFHLPVPESRQAVDSRRLAMYNKTYRPFGAWHEWLMRGLPAWRVPAPPVPPLDGCLYRFAPSFDMARVEALTTTTSLFPTDHTVIRFNPTADGNRLTLS